MRALKLYQVFLLCILVAITSSCGAGGGGGGGGEGGDATIILGDEELNKTLTLKAVAGPDQNVSSGSLIALNGSGSTVTMGKMITYRWSFASVPAGSTATFSDAKVVNPSFIANVPGEYVIVLVVNDGTKDSEADMVIITASVGNSSPVANAGKDQDVSTKSKVTLDGSGSSDANGDLLTYTWTLTSVPAGSTAVLSGAGAVSPSFTPDVDGAYVISLIVNDGSLDSEAESVTVIASSGNSRPVADAGKDQIVITGTTVILSGSGSRDANSLDVLTYLWVFTSVPFSSTAVLSDTKVVNPSFTPNVDGAYVVSLVVNDGTVDSIVDSVTVIASQKNTAPVAKIASDLRVSTGSLVILDGSASSDTDGDILTYNWSLISIPTGSSASFIDSTAKKAMFTPDLAGDYVISLRVYDGMVYSGAEVVTVTALESVVKKAGIFSENFEDGLGEWWVTNGIWEIGTPTSAPNGAYLDSNAAGTVLDGNYPDKTDSQLVSPSIQLPTLLGLGEEIHLRFWHWFSFGSCQDYNYSEKDYGKLEISTQISPGTWSGWTTLNTYTGYSGNWTNSFADLSGYAGKKVRIGFLLDNEAYIYIPYNPHIVCPTSVSSGWYIDEVLVEVK